MATVIDRHPRSLLEDVGLRDWGFRNREVCGSQNKLSTDFSSLTTIQTYPLSQAAPLNDGYYELVRERDRHDFRVDTVHDPRCLLGPRWIRCTRHSMLPLKHVAGHWNWHYFFGFSVSQANPQFESVNKCG